ncbi:MAG: YajG family lipoprotein [Deltaproteobacteria bacterium]|nr:YajG family lipoprotein [Deltaproteobacteria bacterium]
MNNYKNLWRFWVSCSFLLFSFCLSGCALTKEYITVDYTPQKNIEPIRGAEKVNLKVNVNDGRSIRDKVCYKKNAYGMELGEIISNSDVVKLVQDSIKTELTNRGFILNDGNIVINIELIKFFNDFKTGFFAGDASAEVLMGSQVKISNGNIIYNKIITGNYVEQNIQLATGNNAKLALEGALKDAVSKLINDSDFIMALMETKK